MRFSLKILKKTITLPFYKLNQAQYVTIDAYFVLVIIQ